MGCAASKDGVETDRKSGSSQTGRNMSMPVQARGNSDNGFHMVALASSTYGILKTDSLSKDAKDIKSLGISSSTHDAFYEKLKNFDVPDEMLAKPWSEVSRSLPKIPPLTKTDSPRRASGLRRLDSPRQTRGIDSPRQRGSFRRTDSPRRLPSQAPRNDHETINMWELMDGLEEDGTNPAKSQPKPVERIPRSPMIKPFERSITFSTIHTLSELDSGDPSKAITPGPANSVLNNSKSIDTGSNENAYPVKLMSRSISSPIVLKRDEMTVRLTPSSPSLASREAVPSSDPPRPQQPSIVTMAATSEANATLQEVSKALLLPPPSPAPRVAAPSRDPPRPRQPSVSPMTLSPEANATIQEVSKGPLPTPSASLSSAGTKNASVIQARSGSLGLQPSKSTVEKAKDSPMSLNTKLEAEIERAMFEERVVSRGWVQSTAMRSLEPELGRVRSVAATLSQGGAAARPQPTPRRADVKETTNQGTRQLPRFASPIHVLSLAASFDLENRKNSVPHLDLKGPPMSPSPTTMKAGGSRQSFSKQQSMPSPSLRAIPSSDQGLDLQSQVSAPNSGSHGRLDASDATVAPVREGMPVGKSPTGVSGRGTIANARSSLGGTAIDSDLLASFEEALEMFSADEWYNVREIKGEAAAAAVPGVAQDNHGSLPTNLNGISPNGLESEGVSGDKGRQSNGNHEEALTLESPASKSIAVRKTVKPDPWSRFETKCPPAGEGRVVLYTTSLRGIRKTFEDCNNARFIFQSFNVELDERDVSIHAEFRQELKELSEKPAPVPQAFIKGRYIGGMDILTQLHEDGTLAILVGDLPPQLSRGECDGCGGVRFVPCSDCSGSTKVVNETKEVVRCSECNENGLMRCPICY